MPHLAGATGAPKCQPDVAGAELYLSCSSPGITWSTPWYSTLTHESVVALFLVTSSDGVGVGVGDGIGLRAGVVGGSGV